MSGRLFETVEGWLTEDLKLAEATEEEDDGKITRTAPAGFGNRHLAYYR